MSAARFLAPLAILAASVAPPALSASSAPTGATLPLPEMSAPVQRKSGRLSFELLPKAFQKTPQLEMTAVTELSDYGATLPPVTPEHRAYYLGINRGFLERGDSVAGDDPPDANYLGRVLRHALETNGYFPADKTHPPSLVLFFHWGSHAAMDQEMRGMFPQKARRDLLERATLVGGKKFQHALAYHLAYGDLLVDSTGKIDFLTTQAASNLYFVVVSAYDHAALTRNERKLVWRTSLTVESTGVSMTDALPPLVLTGGPYFGRATASPEILLRTVKRGSVKLGPAQVIEADVPLPPRKK